MSHSPALSSTSTPTPASSSSSNFKVIFDKAFRAYKKKTKQDLIAHPLAIQLQACDSPAAILSILQEQVDQFNQSRSGGERMKKWLIPTINVLYAFSATLCEGAALTFSPAKVIFAGTSVLLLAAKDVEESQDILIDVFERLENFFKRLEIYTEVTPTTAMTDMMVKIMVEILDILANATIEMKQGRTKKFLKRVAGIKKLEDGLKKLDSMTNEEARMATAELLKVTRRIDEKVDGVDAKVQDVGSQVKDVDEKVQGVDNKLRDVDVEVQAIDKKVQCVDENVKVVEQKVQLIIDDRKEATPKARVSVQKTAYDVDDAKRRQLLESLRTWQSPSDPSTNHNIASDRLHEGTTAWFCQGNIFEEWKLTGSLLWIHGKPGSGKSVLCSAIINDIATLHKDGSAFVAYFYFDFRDVDKKSCRDLLRSLLIQLSARSEPFCNKLSRFHKEHDNGMRQPSDSALMKCLVEMLTHPTNQCPVYLIMDALDESPNTSGIPSSREEVLDLVKQLVGLHLPSLHICVTSRSEVDIQHALQSLAPYSISLHHESGQKKDIFEYVKSVVRAPTTTFMKRWRDEDKDLVINTLSDKADGMFRWVYCQLETLRHCVPQNVPRVLSQLPASLDETYERVLKEIGDSNQVYAYRLLQCLTVAARPLLVEELAEILAFDFDPNEEIPILRENWRWKDQQEAVLLTCSSLVTVVDDGSHRVVQFSHFSVKEFLTSDRLATSNTDVSNFHILPEPAHTVIVKACMGILLKTPNDLGDAGAKCHSPLAKYAAEHWVYHAQFKKVWTRVKDGMRRLFDSEKPYFDAWLDLYDVDEAWTTFVRPGRYRHEDRGSPLYYASLCGFGDLAAHLVAKYPQHVNAMLGKCLRPLAAALYKKHFDIAELLHQHGAAVGILGYCDQTLLHAALLGGFADTAQWILDHGMDVGSQQHLRMTSFYDDDSEDEYLWPTISVEAMDGDNQTPLHLASLRGYVEIVEQLLWQRADVTARSSGYFTPLHLASFSESAETVRVLIEHGADVNARGEFDRTPLHLASPWSGLDGFIPAKAKAIPKIVRVLLEYDADVAAQDITRSTPLHFAACSGSPEAVQLLIEHGADVAARDDSLETPLHLTSSWDDCAFREPNPAKSKAAAETVRVLIEHGADVTAQGWNQSTPLHHASFSGNSETVRELMKHGADVTALNRDRRTPLHNATSTWSTENVRLLVEHGANVNAQDMYCMTPLHLVLFQWSLVTVRPFNRHEAGANERSDRINSSIVSPPRERFRARTEIVRLLIAHGADVTLQDRRHMTPLHLASSWDDTDYGEHNPVMSNTKAEIVRLMVEHGADVNAQDETYLMPLHLASFSGSIKSVQALIEYGADVLAQDRRLMTPLHLASSWYCSDSREPNPATYNAKTDIARILIERGADVTMRDENHWTPLHLASLSGSAEAVRLLIEHGADVTVQDRRLRTPLHLASSRDDDSNYDEPDLMKANAKAEIVRLLIEHGADVTALDETHSTPLHLASPKKSVEVVKLLIQNGADVNAQDRSRSTPLHLAASSYLSEGSDIVSQLLRHGANVDAEDSEGRTPLQIGSLGWNSTIAKLLSDHRARRE